MRTKKTKLGRLAHGTTLGTERPCSKWWIADKMPANQPHHRWRSGVRVLVLLVVNGRPRSVPRVQRVSASCRHLTTLAANCRADELALVAKKMIWKVIFAVSQLDGGDF